MAPDLVECEAHGTPTRLRCAEAGGDRPICPQCLVKTAVGLKCEEHAQAIAPKFTAGPSARSSGRWRWWPSPWSSCRWRCSTRAEAGAGAGQHAGAGSFGGAQRPGADRAGVGLRRERRRIGAKTLTNRALAFDAHPAWSPDGARIAFESTVDGKRTIWVMQADGQGLRRLTELTGAAAETAPALPRGDRIAYASDRDGNSEIVRGKRRRFGEPAAHGQPGCRRGAVLVAQRCPDRLRRATATARPASGSWAPTARRRPG